MGDYIATVQTNALAVRNTGAAFEEKLVVAVIFGNLPEHYSEVATALDTLDVVTISKATAMPKLRSPWNMHVEMRMVWAAKGGIDEDNQDERRRSCSR